MPSAPSEAREVVGFLGIVATNGCEPWLEDREMNAGPLPEQQILLTTEVSLQPSPFIFYSENILSSEVSLEGKGKPRGQR